MYVSMYDRIYISYQGCFEGAIEEGEAFNVEHVNFINKQNLEEK